MGGEFVVDVDSYFVLGLIDTLGKLSGTSVMVASKSRKALILCDRILENYSRVEIVFSGRRGFHIHALDFDYKDWSRPSAERPLRAMTSCRFKYTMTILPELAWDRSHFILSFDPMRVVTVPDSLNMDTGLVCRHIGGREDLARLSIQSLLEKSKPLAEVYSDPFNASLLWLPLPERG